MIPNETNQRDHAFPLEVTSDNSTYQCGMTLEDYFAAKAMQALLTNWNIRSWDGPITQQSDMQRIVRLARLMGKAMVGEKSC